MSQVTEMVVIIRPSFMKFCDDGCRAAAFNHILYWIAYKAKDEPQEKIQAADISWYGTSEEIAEGMANAWSSQKVRPEVNKLVDMGLIGRRSNPQWKVDRTKFFFFGPEQCATFLELCKKHSICLFGLGLSKEVLRLLACCAKANDKVIQCSCGQHDKQIINLSDGTIYLSDGRTNISLANDKYVRAITKVSTKDTTKVTTKDKKGVDNATPEPLFASDDAPPQNNATENTLSEQTRKDYHQRIYDSLVKLRGGELDGNKIGWERGYVNRLITDKKFTPEQVDRFLQYLVEDDWRYRKPGERYRITAKTIFDEATTLVRILSDPDYLRQKQKAGNASQSRNQPATPSDIAAAQSHTTAQMEKRRQKLLSQNQKGA
jgi:hypothetical protein